MSRAVAAAFALACAPPPGGGPDPDPDPDPVAAFGSPAEAIDLRPDDPEQVLVRLVAAPHRLVVDGVEVDGWAYNGQVPGPTIRARRGQRLTVELVSELPDPTTIHWHGVHVPFEMDGAAWMHDPVPPGGTFTYSFDLDQVGTFWYHPHFDTSRQVDLGLYGAIIIEDPDDPPVDVELVAVLDSWDELADRDDHHGLDGARPTVTVNGRVDPTLVVPAGSSVRIRWINAANIAYAAFDGPGLRAIGGDQGLLSRPREGLTVLAPGERAESDLAVGEAVEISLHRWSLYGGALPGEPRRLLSVAPDGGAPAPVRPAWAFDGQPPSDDPPYTDLTYVLQGDPTTGDWRINGERFPDVTPFALPAGADAILEVRNLSGSRHPFHLHGHDFELLSRDGVPPPHREIHDTLDIGLLERVRLRLHADNPGHWMLHCHILPHADGGMMTVLQVGDPDHD